MPQIFRNPSLSTRCIIDTTEIFIDKAKNHTSSLTLIFSNYENHNTFKALVEISPSRAIFASNLHRGNMSDSSFRLTGLLEEWDSVMVDRGFTISD